MATVPTAPSSAASKDGPALLHISEPSFILTVNRKVHENDLATRWLVALGFLFVLVGILLQLLFRSWWYSILWIIGVLFLITACIVHASASSLRSCMANPALCMAMMKTMNEYKM